MWRTPPQRNRLSPASGHQYPRRESQGSASWPWKGGIRQTRRFGCCLASRKDTEFHGGDVGQRGPGEVFESRVAEFVAAEVQMDEAGPTASNEGMDALEGDPVVPFLTARVHIKIFKMRWVFREQISSTSLSPMFS